MKTIKLHSLLLVAAAMALGSARADESTSHIAFSDPSKPGTLKIRVWQGAVVIRGADVKDITVRTESTAEEPSQREDGMRVLSASSSYRLSEKGNVVSLEYGTDGWSGAPADFEITVPKETSVVAANSIRGDLECTGLSGDIDVRTLDGDVKTRDLSGGVCVETMNGEITVDMKAVKPSKPLCLTSMNGKITIRVPEDSKAGVRFRTHHGLILTNFDDKALVTRTEVSRHVPRKEQGDMEPSLAAPAAPAKPAVPASPDARPASPDAPVGPVAATEPAPRAESDGDWHNEVREQIREAADDARLAVHEASEAMRESVIEIHTQLGKIPPLPPMTGGKVVSGTLNGGGGDIQASTLNGDIIFQKSGGDHP